MWYNALSIRSASGRPAAGENLHAPIPSNEVDRLAALRSLRILDAPRDEEFDDIARLAARVCDAPIAMITVVDRDRQWHISEIGLGVRESPRDTSFCGHTILEREILVIPDTHKDPRFVNNPNVTGAPHVRFYAGAVLRTADGLPIGTLCIIDRKPREFSDEQRDILRVLARQVMRQLELRSLLHEQARILEAQEQATRILADANAHYKRIAETLQRSLLRNVRDRAFGDLDVASLYEAAWSESDIGGDFHDAFQIGSGKVALVLGDVAGKGLGAAARTAEVKYALRAFLQEYPHPARTLSRLNDFLCGFHDFGEEENPRFVVAALGVIDPESGEGVFSFAGSEPAIILRRDGAAETLTGRGLPLGIQPNEDYQTFACQLAPGDTLALVTDGLTEARRGSQYLGHEGIVEIAAKACARGSVGAAAEEILTTAKSYAGGSLRDDACLLLARRRG